MRTLARSASNSSATLSGSEVSEPCPISVAADMMVIVPSGVIDSHGLNALPARSLPTTAARAVLPESAIANVRPAAPTISWRRDRRGLSLEDRLCCVMALALPRGALDGAHDALIGAAAADV